MLKHTILSLSFLAAFAVQAQTAAPAAGGKKELAARILRAQQPSIEGMARGLAERPALEVMNNAMPVVAARVLKERQEQVAKEIQGDAQKYADEAVPIVQRRAVALAPSTIGSILEEKFSEDELRQIAAALENPAFVKYQRTLPEMQQALGEKLIADTRAQIEPKANALDESVAKRLGIPLQGGAAAPAAPQGKAPAKK